MNHSLMIIVLYFSVTRMGEKRANEHEFSGIEIEVWLLNVTFISPQLIWTSETNLKPQRRLTLNPRPPLALPQILLAVLLKVHPVEKDLRTLKSLFLKQHLWWEEKGLFKDFQNKDQLSFAFMFLSALATSDFFPSCNLAG